MLSATIRSIVDSDCKIDKNVGTIKYSLKPHKVFLFDKETEERIYFGDQQPLVYEDDAQVTEEN
jgi:hypothetical protein